MNILVTLPEGELRENLLPPEQRQRLERLGDVTYNEHADQLTNEELADSLQDIDVCITGWGTTTLDETALARADDLSLVAHIGGSVAVVGSHALYDEGVTVCSANEVMSKYVAEGVLTYILSGLRDVPNLTAEMRAGAWPDKWDRTETLFDRTVGFVGLGDVGRTLLNLLDPFDVTALVYDPYVEESAVEGYDAHLKSLDTVLSESPIVSIHASLTSETHHLLDAERLDQLQEDALLVNAARGKIVDQSALVDELESGRIQAVLDVYNEEPLPSESPLRSLENVDLFPHVAGAPSRSRLAETVISEIERFVEREPLNHEIPRERFELMTDDYI
ncbi:hydroxyacid dehydrogenase [Halorussus salinisoli]|uniref:hydroxyacid dehydrogenase n=1 Tax=Halorussus salinisoli TaxID=2558242 RepID=UPI0010C21B1D|nr:hydroxyacid dehydrogenase [Halorussus salinisoli]